MKAKEKILDFIKRYKIYIITGIAVLFSLFIVLTKNDFSKVEFNPQSVVEFKLKITSDMNRLDCYFEQRRCYYKVLGIPKENAITYCEDIDFCDNSFKPKGKK